MVSKVGEQVLAVVLVLVPVAGLEMVPVAGLEMVPVADLGMVPVADLVLVPAVALGMVGVDWGKALGEGLGDTLG